MAASAAFYALAAWRAARPARFGRVRVMPWTALSITAGALFVLLAVHALRLAAGAS